MIICFVVAPYRNIAYACLIPFIYPDLHINRVILHIHFHRGGIEKQVSVVHVQRADIKAVGVKIQVGFQQFLIVHISFLDTQNSAQKCGRIYGISYPGNVSEIILITLFQEDLYANILVINPNDRVAGYMCITIPFFIVFGYNQIQIILIICFNIL